MIEIIQADITTLDVDAIVDAANSALRGGTWMARFTDALSRGLSPIVWGAVAGAALSRATARLLRGRL